MEQARPTTQRAYLLDALRGFALFGVVYSNFAGLAFWMMLPPEQKAALPGAFLDEPLEWFRIVFIDGKFYSIFSMLFGIGFGFFLEKGSDGLLRFYRRMLVLLVIGWLHLRYLWAGDILFLYALLGLLLPLFRKFPDRVLLVLAAILIISPIAVDAVVVLTDGRIDPVAPLLARLEALDAELGYTTFDALLAMPGGGWDEFVAANDRTWLFRFEHLVAGNRPQKVLGLFLIGLWVARRKLFVVPEQHRTLLRRTCIAGTAVGLPFCGLMWWSGKHLGDIPAAGGLIGTASSALGVVPLAIAYASGFALLWTKDRWRRRLTVLAPMGRMALTNYLLQTIIGLALFTGVGLGWGTHVSAVQFESLALALFIVQVIWSRWWLAHFQYGPFEWAWRSLTYGKVMPMRK
ncbi:MAG TPA: DUF418 domain-containing protein [Flavobacteriales bacterium]|nr:DUF418 domain-containing protein [Flavobacteriales bacterium]